jgi:hypothetical protein
VAFPAVVNTNTTRGTTASATPVVNLPASIVAGRTLVVLFRCAVAGAIGWPDGNWIELFDASSDGADDQMACAYRKATGSEGASITLSCTSGKFAAIAYQISGAADPAVTPPQLSTVAFGASAEPDPTTCTPTGGAKDYLWLWLGGWEGEQTSPPAGDPANFTGAIGADSGTASTPGTNCRVAGSTRQLNAASLDAGLWTIDPTEDWTAYLMAIHPAPPSAPATFLTAPYMQHGRRIPPASVPRRR